MNDYRPNVAAIQRSHNVMEQLRAHTWLEPWTVRRDRLRKELAAGGDYKVKNDLATSLAHTGEAAEAVTLLEQIEAERPGLYVTAANLGTAYELAGNNEKALEWIRKGIERNPNAHEGTEWLHVRILEAKLALKHDPTWLDSNSLVGARKTKIYYGAVNILPTEITATGNRGEQLSAEQVKAALIYQLHERMQFVQPPDAIVGSMLFELGDLLAKEPTGIAGAADVFNFAANYLKGLPNVQTVQENADFRGLSANMGQRLPPSAWRQNVADFALLGIFGILISLPVLKRGLERQRLVKKERAAAQPAIAASILMDP
jgi:tetratricopeptide (TPR) repeat protein